MSIDTVVVNASPLITLFRSGQADVLPSLFKRVVVPQPVWDEVVLDAWDDPASRELREQTPMSAVRWRQYRYTPRPLLRPSQPAATISLSRGQGRYLESAYSAK